MTTEDSGEHPKQERRHKQPGQRESDTHAYSVAALVEGASDQVLLGWTWGRLARIGTVLIMVWGLYTWILARVVSQKELSDLTARVEFLEKQQKADETQRYVRAIVKLMCRGTDAETAALVDLPCASLGAPTKRP